MCNLADVSHPSFLIPPPRGKILSDVSAPWSLLRFLLAICELVNSLAVLNSHTGLCGQRVAGLLHVQTLAEQVEAAHDGDQEHEEAWRRNRKR